MAFKIINAALILFATFMGFKQAYALLSFKPEMLDMFGKWNFSENIVAIFGVVTILSAGLILVPKTFLWGNFLMATTILLIICLHLQNQNLKDAAIELPFLLLNLLIILLRHPFTKAA